MKFSALYSILFVIILQCFNANGFLLSKNEKSIPKKESKKDMSYYRLPNSTKPLEQLIRLQPFINGNNSIKGYTEITFEVLQPTSNVILHMADIITLNETIKISSTDNLDESIPITNNAYDVERQFYIVSLGTQLKRQKTYVLSMEFLGYLNEFLVGFYRSFYTDANGNKHLLAVSQFASNYARYAFPCYDEPAMKAKFKVQIARQKIQNAFSNMPKETSQPLEGQPGWVLDTFLTSLPMSSYLVTFLVSDFVSLNSTQHEHVLFRVWVREAAIKQASYALSIGPSVLSYFEDYFSIPFQLPKQDMAAIPDFYYGGMENWGLINYREADMLYDPFISSAQAHQRICIIVAHELAHNWYGNLVTMQWWNDIWLNEGFATFMQYPGCDSVEPSFKVMDQFTVDELHTAMQVDSLETSHPLSNPITSPEQIHEVYDTIAYSKGGSLIRMMNSFLTSTTFQKGVSNYVKNFSYSNANENDLWHFLTEQGHADGTLEHKLTVKKIMDTWSLQMGYPVLNVQRFNNGTVFLKQERFLLEKNENSEDTHEYIWWVPLTYASEDSPDFSKTTVMEWMSNTEKEKTLTGFPTKDKWVIFNVQQNGYYRVNYDIENWNALVSQLQNDNSIINTLNRAQILDDAYNLAKAGMLSYETTLSINAYLDKEKEYVPMKTALKQLGYLNSMLERTSRYIGMKNYMTDLLVPLYNQVGFEDNLNDSHQDQLKRELIVSWTCKIGYESCVQNSVSLYNEWMANPEDNSIISANLRRTVYCTAIAQGDELEWNFAYTRYLKSNVGNEKDNLLYGMGCTKVIWIIERYLDMTFSATSGIRKQDINKVFSSLSVNVYANSLAWDYLRENNDDISAYAGQNSIADLTSIVSKNFNTEQWLRELEQFQEDLGSSVNLKQSIETTQNNIEWMNSYYGVVTAWLNDNGYGDNISGL